MDEEDGILGSKLSTKDEYDATGARIRKLQSDALELSNTPSNAIPGPSPFIQYIAPNVNNIGKRFISSNHPSIHLSINLNFSLK
jgi:hypothetical protein